MHKNNCLINAAVIRPNRHMGGLTVKGLRIAGYSSEKGIIVTRNHLVLCNLGITRHNPL